jgi:hypothetical protein
MAIPVSVVLDRGGQGPRDLTPLIDGNSLDWSSVVPGGFASCSFQLAGDFRRLLKQLPYLSIVRVIGDSGRVLFEGQIEDLAPTLSESTIGVRVSAYGLQNVLKETSARHTWMKRDMNWSVLPAGVVSVGETVTSSLGVNIGQFDATDLSKVGVQVLYSGSGTLANNSGAFAQYDLPIGLSISRWIGMVAQVGTDSGTTKWTAIWQHLDGGSWSNIATDSTGGAPFEFSLGLSGTENALRLGAYNHSGVTITPAANDTMSFYNMRFLGLITTEDDSSGLGGGFYGGTLINSILGITNELNPGVIESGTDFLIDHLDASQRRTLYDLLTEVASYYSREWAVWEDATFNWTTPNLSQNEWIVPLNVLSALDLDASVQNSQEIAFVLYTDAATGLTAEQNAISTDRRNPYVLNGRFKSEQISMGAMTSSTAAQLAGVILNDLGFGPVPAAGTISLPGDTIIQHAQGNAAKAWEIRAGDNVTIPELPLADVFTQDGRGECLFHIVSAEASGGDGTVTLSLDSYGSKRSDVLMARLAAVTQALGG